ncbi:MAG TPA: hypothetical protein VN457_07950 [Chlamydiales bacterium]|nr:hypothetical protein [Chlamydiales bacterium]
MTVTFEGSKAPKYPEGHRDSSKDTKSQLKNARNKHSENFVAWRQELRAERIDLLLKCQKLSTMSQSWKQLGQQLNNSHPQVYAQFCQEVDTVISQASHHVKTVDYEQVAKEANKRICAIWQKNKAILATLHLAYLAMAINQLSPQGGSQSCVTTPKPKSG